MAGSKKTGALLAGVMLILIGGILLAENFYRSISFWGLLSRYWPVLLILIGLKKLHGHLTWNEGPDQTPIPPVPGAGQN